MEKKTKKPAKRAKKKIDERLYPLPNLANTVRVQVKSSDTDDRMAQAQQPPQPPKTMQQLRDVWDWDSHAAEQFLASCGKSHTTLKQAAMILGYDQDYFAHEYAKRPKLVNAYHSSKVATIRQVGSALIDSALKGDTKAAMFFLRNRDPDNYKDTQHHEVAALPTIIIQGLDDE